MEKFAAFCFFIMVCSSKAKQTVTGGNCEAVINYNNTEEALPSVIFLNLESGDDFARTHSVGKSHSLNGETYILKEVHFNNDTYLYFQHISATDDIGLDLFYESLQIAFHKGYILEDMDGQKFADENLAEYLSRKNRRSFKEKEYFDRLGSMIYNDEEDIHTGDTMNSVEDSRLEQEVSENNEVVEYYEINYDEPENMLFIIDNSEIYSETELMENVYDAPPQVNYESIQSADSIEHLIKITAGGYDKDCKPNCKSISTLQFPDLKSCSKAYKCKGSGWPVAINAPSETMFKYLDGSMRLDNYDESFCKSYLQKMQKYVRKFC